MNPKACYLSAAMSISCAIPAAAHHSFAMFDRDKTVEMQGTVKAFQWTNPHSFLDVYVEDPKGVAPVLWTLEFGSVPLSGMNRANANRLPYGDTRARWTFRSGPTSR